MMMRTRMLSIRFTNHLYPSILALLCSSGYVQSQILSGLLSGLTGGILQPGTPAVYTTAAPGITDSTTSWQLGGSGLTVGTPAQAVPFAAAGSDPRVSTAVQQQQLIPAFGWLFPVYTNTLRDNCVVYEGSGNENLQQVSALFGLNYASVLADNQGVISSPNEPLAGRSVLLCGTTGPPRPVQATPRPGAGTTAAPTPRGSRTPSAAAAAGPSSATPQPLAPSQLPAPPAVKPQVSPELQKQALFKFKAAVDPKDAVLKDWKPSLGHCTWVFVTCDANKNVVRLNMVYLGLDGRLPSGAVMKNLPHLKEIYLGGNELKGPLPADWADHMRPRELFLNDNMLSGPLPASWGKMKSLRVLSLPYNQFSGPLPATWGQLSSLRILKLNNNKLSGPVPQKWAGMKAISTITLFNNAQMKGCVPETWSGKGSSGKGYFQSPSGSLSSNIKDATRGTGIQGYCCKGWSYCV